MIVEKHIIQRLTEERVAPEATLFLSYNTKAGVRVEAFI